MKRYFIIFVFFCFVVQPLFSNSKIWITNDSHKVLRNESVKKDSNLFNAKTKTIQLYGAKNEFLAFQVVIPGPLKNVEAPILKIKDSKGKALEHTNIYREHFIKHVSMSQYEKDHYPKDVVIFNEKRKKMGAAWEYPVQMVPLHAKKYGAPFDVKENQNEVLFVEFFIPENSPKGNYTGSLKVAGEVFKIKLKVWNFAIPSVSHFPNWVYVGPETIAYSFRKKPSQIKGMMEIFDGYFQMAHNHRISLMESIEGGPKYMKAADRNFYDYYTGKAFKGPFAAGFGYELLPIAGDGAGWIDFLEKEKWLNRTFSYTWDEPSSAAQYNQIIKKCAKIKSNSKNQIRTFVTEQFIPSKKEWPSLSPAIDIFCSGGTPPSQIPEVEKKGGVVWTYNSGHAGVMLSDGPGVAPRTHAWAGYLSGSRAWYFWEGVYVVDKHNKWRHIRREIRKNPSKYITDTYNTALNFDEATKRKKNGKLYPAAWSLRLNGDGLLFYPGYDVGINGPIGSFRIKGIRRGTQDFEYLYLLDKMGKSDIAKKAAEGLFKNVSDGKISHDGQTGKEKYDYNMDSSKWEEARIKMGEALDKIGDSQLRKTISPYNQYPNPVGHPDYYSGKRF